MAQLSHFCALQVEHYSVGDGQAPTAYWNRDVKKKIFT
jgi:hypothetical protein